MAYNAELLLFEGEPRQLLKAEYRTLIKTAKSAAGELTSLRFDPRRRQMPLKSASFSNSASPKAIPAAEAPEEKTKAGDVFMRFSAYENDNRIREDRSLRPGTYATVEEDAKNVKTGKDAVARYALPNPQPASYRFTIKPEKDTVIQKGTVEPAYGQPGGGVEVIFKDGTTAGTVTLPPDKLPDE